MDDEEAIRRLLALTCQLRDDSRYDLWCELFSEDGTFSYLDYLLEGRLTIREHMEEHFFPSVGKHLCLNHVIDVEGDRARAISDFVKLQPAPAGGLYPIATGRYDDRLVREGGRGWRISSRRVEILGAS